MRRPSKYTSVDEAMEEIRKLGLEGHGPKGGSNGDPKKVIREEELEGHLAEGWDLQTILPSGRILIRKVA